MTYAEHIRDMYVIVSQAAAAHNRAAPIRRRRAVDQFSQVITCCTEQGFPARAYLPA